MPSLRQKAQPYVILALASFLAVLPLVLHGCSCGHDFDFHLLSWMDAARQISQGNLHPHWAFSPAWNAGEPRFVFYPPLSWYLGAFLGLVLTHLPRISASAAWNAAPIAFTWIALALAGSTMYRLAREFAGETASLLAAAAYLANPYMLFTAYERTAYAELLAAAWLPLLVHAILRRHVTLPRIAVPLALLWLTNAPAAVIGSYTLGLLAAGRLITPLLPVSLQRYQGPAPLVNSTLSASVRLPARLRLSLDFALTTFAGTALGLLLAAFYIVPAAYERRYVQIAMAVLPGMRIQDNFLFHHTTGPDAALHDQVLQAASVIALLLLGTCVGLLALNILVRRRARAAEAASPCLPVLPLSVLVAVAGFLLTPWSLPLWRHAPEAAFLQFPWRAESVLAVVAALTAAGALSWLRWNALAGSATALVFALSLTGPAYLHFRQSCDPEDAAGARLAVFQSSGGAEPTDEYTPVDADNDALHKGDPPFWLASTPGAPPPSKAALQPGPAPLHFAVRSPRAGDLVLNLREYPAWTVLLDGGIDLQRLKRDDGLLAFPIPAGTSTIELRYSRLPEQKTGDLFSLLGLGLAAASAVPARWRMRRTGKP